MLERHRRTKVEAAERWLRRNCSAAELGELADAEVWGEDTRDVYVDLGVPETLLPFASAAVARLIRLGDA
jgi:hypothetical protein